MNKLLAAGAVAALAGVAAAGTTNVRITEIYAGAPGPNGTSDWFEITNEGTSAVSTGGWFYDDDSFNPEQNDALSNLTIGAGESVVFLVSWEDDYTDVTDAIAEFAAFWGSTMQVGFVSGGSGLGGGGDAVSVFDGNTLSANLLASAAYIGSLTESNATIEYPFGPVGQNSVAGVNGAYESFLNAGDPDGPLIGSPGAVPAPGVAAVLALGGLAASRRRR